MNGNLELYKKMRSNLTEVQDDLCEIISSRIEEAKLPFKYPTIDDNGTLNMNVYKIRHHGRDKTQIYLENMGVTELKFFTGEKSEENIGVVLSPGEEATLNLNEIGNENNLIVENLSTNKKGEYLVKI